MHGRTHGRTDNVKTVYPLQTKFAGGIINVGFQGWISELQTGKTLIRLLKSSGQWRIWGGGGVLWVLQHP